MALIGRLFVIFFGFLAACLVAGMIVVGAVLFPEFSDLGEGPVDSGALNIILGFGFIFVSGFALVPAMVVAAVTEAFYVRLGDRRVHGVLDDRGPQRRGVAAAAAPAATPAADAGAFAAAAVAAVLN